MGWMKDFKDAYEQRYSPVQANTNMGQVIRRMVVSLGMAKPANFVWRKIYPHTSLYRGRNKALRRLFSGLVNTGDLVFDVGANYGVYTNLFLSMQVRSVVTVEPNVRLAKKLVRSGVYSVNVALGSHNHYANYYTGELDGFSTLSLEFMQLRKHNGFQWEKPTEIYVTTLDALSKMYGIPDFIKIDVEGYESEVIDGMSFAPKALSFEFVPEDIDSVIKCTTRLDSLGDYQYNYTVGLEPNMQFAVPWWNNANDVIEYIRHSVPEDAFGDVWVRRKDTWDDIESNS